MNKLTIIKNCVCRAREVSPMMLNGKNRKTEIVTARYLCYYFARELTKLTFQEMGRLIGGKDHATVIHGCKTVENLIFTDKAFAIEVDSISKDIKKAIDDAKSQTRRRIYNRYSYNARFNRSATRLTPVL